MPDEAPEGERGGVTRRRLAQVWRHIPFTLTVVALMLVLGVVTSRSGTPWKAGRCSPTSPTGCRRSRTAAGTRSSPARFFAIAPWQYLPVAGGFLLLVGLAEWHLGTRRAAIAAVGGPAAGAALRGGAARAVLTATLDWAWAVRTADDLDVGF